MEKLFKKWQNEYSFSAFIKDGIVSAEKYEQPHILFVLREMNCSVPNDLRKDLREHGSGGKTWSNVGRWVKALLDNEEDYPYDMSPERRKKQLSRVAVLNIKKEGGTSRAEGQKIVEYAKEQRQMILEQIKLCSPHIIICCGQQMKGAPSNAVILEEYVFGVKAQWQNIPSCELPREWAYYEVEINGRLVPVVSFCHPQVTNLCGKRGHENLFKPLYKDMRLIGKTLLKKTEN